MFHSEVLQNQWLVEALIGGAAFLLVFILWYSAQWKPRRSETVATEENRHVAAISGRDQRPEIVSTPPRVEYEVDGDSASGKVPLPGIVIFVYVGTVVCAVVYLIARSFNSPNW